MSTTSKAPGISANTNFDLGHDVAVGGRMVQWAACRRFVRMLSGRWKIEIFALLSDRTRRFGELRRQIPDISAQSLSVQLREMEIDGLIQRADSGAGRTDYSLTPFARSLDQLFVQIAALPLETPVQTAAEAREAA